MGMTGIDGMMEIKVALRGWSKATLKSTKLSLTDNAKISNDNILMNAVLKVSSRINKRYKLAV